MRECRCCGANVESSPILNLENMPGKAQNFPDEENLDLDKGVDLEIYQCPHCGLIQLFCPPVSYYRDVIRAVGVSEDMKIFRKSYFHAFVMKYNLQGKKILEVGAGSGEYMEILAKENVDVYGIEHLLDSVVQAKKKGLKVYSGFIENANTKISGMPYDAFYIMNFLEHIPNPKIFLRGIANNLKEDAYGLIEVPNGDFIIQNQMFSEFMLDHLMYFTKESLSLLLSLCGFEVIECQVIWNSYIISAIVRKRKTIDTDLFWGKQQKLVSAINTYVEEKNKSKRKVAVWGAGHQALALIALAKLQGKIECVIDSAEFKQNKFTPATHIPIYSSNRIDDLGIQELIIIAGSYSNEIFEIVKKKYPDVHAITLDLIEDKMEEK